MDREDAWEWFVTFLGCLLYVSFITALLLWFTTLVHHIPRCSIHYFYIPALNKSLNSPDNTTLNKESTTTTFTYLSPTATTTPLFSWLTTQCQDSIKDTRRRPRSGDRSFLLTTRWFPGRFCLTARRFFGWIWRRRWNTRLCSGKQEGTNLRLVWILKSMRMEPLKSRTKRMGLRWRNQILLCD